MQIKENVYGIALFGSWSRGDAADSSDIDLLIIDKNDFDCEYVERIETNGLLIDLDHVPKKWTQTIPPEIDQKLYEMQIFYDRDWSLNNVKLLMTKLYSSPERVDIRTEAHVIDSDIYLSRATSALSREDFRSAHLFAVIALENILKVLFEVILEPFSNSSFLEKLELVTAKLGMRELFNEYLAIAKLNAVDAPFVKDKLKLYKLIWGEIKAVAEQNQQIFESVHFKVKTKLNYYLSPLLLQGLFMRTNSLVESGKVAEASHYLDTVFLDFVESYVWLKSLINGLKADYSTLVRSLERLERKNPKNYSDMLNFLALNSKDKLEVTTTIHKTRKMVAELRGERRSLIKKHLIRA